VKEIAMVTSIKPGILAFAPALIQGNGPFPVLLPDRRNRMTRDELLHRIRAEFAEMPCLRLTTAQAARLFGVAEEACSRLLGSLVTERVLWRGTDGRYGRRNT
jgi:hypothetical protein